MADFIDIVVPDASQEGTESVLAGWLKQVGEWVDLHEPLLEINTDKVNMELPSPAAGTLTEIIFEENQQIEPGDVLGRIQVGEKTAAAAPQPEKDKQQPVKIPAPSLAPVQRETGLSPAVRRLVMQHGLDTSRITGTGRGGRITYDDVERFMQAAPGAPASGPIQSERIPHTPMRSRIANHMVESMLKTAPHVTAVFEVDMSAVAAHRSQNKAALQAQGTKLTFTSYFVAAAVQALQAVPHVNSRWHDDALEILADCNIGIATALESGLIVPVIHQAQDLDLQGLATRLQDLTERARRNRLDPKEVQNGTLTITNHGVSGSLIATPIINQPQSAILGIGKLEKRVKVIEVDGHDTLQIRPMIYATLTIDHRALDGFQANQFLTQFAKTLESWSDR